jgi:hypothetical protein
MRTIHHGETFDNRRCTIVGLYNKADRKIKFGVAICGPRDQFSRKTGRTIAEGRADKHPTLVKERTIDIEENKEGYTELSKLGIEVLHEVQEDPYIFQELLTEQYRKHKKINKK